MSVIKPQKPLHLIEELNGGLRISIPSRKRGCDILLMAIAVLWITVFVGVGLVGLAQLLYDAGIKRIDTAPFTVFLCFMALFAGVAIAMWILSIGSLAGLLVGKEIIEVNHDSIKHNWQIILPFQKRSYAIDKVANLRVIAAPPLHRRYKRFGLWRMKLGSLSFNYESKPIYLANEIDEAEAKIILRAIQTRFPQLSIVSSYQTDFDETGISTKYRATIKKVDDFIKIMIPNSRNWFLIIYLCLCLLLLIPLLVLFGRIAYVELTGGALPEGWARVGWIAFGIMFLSLLQASIELHWALWGAEVITVTDQFVQLQIRTLLPGFISKFRISSLSDLRFSPNLPSKRSWIFAFDDLALSSLTGAWDTGTIAFDYGAKTYRFGKNLDESEARQIVALIHQRFPQYR